MDHEYFMRMALSLAKKGQGYTSPNPMVGAVVVKNGEVVGRGYHRAVGQAGPDLEGVVEARRREAADFGLGGPGLRRDSGSYVV